MPQDNPPANPVPNPLRSALRAVADAVGAAPSDQELDRMAPIVMRILRNEVRGPEMPELGETEPAFGLRFDVGEAGGPK